MKTYDCFLFFDELDLLELRLTTLDPVVDVFVLVEASVTLSGRAKPLHFRDNRERFARWLPKIRRVEPRFGLRHRSAWARESESRRAFVQGLGDAEPEDLVFVSDLDEIWRPEKKLAAVDSCRLARFHQDLHYYYLDMRRVGGPWRRGTVRVRYADFVDAQSLRMATGAHVVEQGGWHFSYLGGAERIAGKIRAFAHTEYSTPEFLDQQRIRERVVAGEDIFGRGMIFERVPVDSTFPLPMLEDPRRWAHLLSGLPAERAPKSGGESGETGRRSSRQADAAPASRATADVAERWRARARRLASRAAWSGWAWADRSRPARGAEVHEGGAPFVSVLLVAADASPRLLECSIDSLRRQSRRDWELRAVVDARANPAAVRALEQAQTLDSRIRVESEIAGDPGRSHAVALASAAGAWVSILRPGEELASVTVAVLRDAVSGSELFDVLYGDDARVGAFGIASPRELPDWSPALLEGYDYLDSRVFLRAERLREAGGFRAGCGEAFAYEALLRATEAIAPGRVRHLPEVLRFCRAGSAPGALARGASPRGKFRRVLEEHLARVRPGARVEPVAGFPSLRRVVDPLPSPCRVAVIVPIRDRDDLLRDCMRDVLGVAPPAEVEPVVVDNGSTDPATLRLLDELAADHGVCVLRRPEPFNFSALCNAGAASSTSRLLCFLNNDVAARDPGWLAELARLASIADVGAAGPLLRYPDGRLQHLGIRVEHPFPRLLGDLASEEELRDRPARHVVHEVAAVTGGCLVTRRDVFERVGGFDEDLAVAYNDVDFCLRVRAAGLRVLWTPFVEMTHELCATRGRAPSPERRARHDVELARFVERWGAQMRRDPFAAGLP